MSPRERVAIIGLIAVALIGHAVRIFAVAPDDAPGGITLIEGLAPADPGAHRALSERVGRPLADGEVIDLNRATAAEIARLPKVGMGLAKALVRARSEEDGFAGIEDVDRVAGIGPGLLAAIRPHLALGDTDGVRRRRGTRGPREAVAGPPPAVAPPLVVRDPKRRVAGAQTGGAPGSPIRLNSASQADLERLPGIGPSRAKAILAYRQTNGPFASVSDLQKVPGISRRLVGQLASQVAVP